MPEVCILCLEEIVALDASSAGVGLLLDVQPPDSPLGASAR